MLKKMFPLVIMLLVVVISAPSYAGWLDFDRQGVRLFYGDSSMTSVGPTPAEVDSYTWKSASYVLEKDIYNWLSLQAMMGVGFLDSPIQSSPSVETRIRFNAHYSPFYLALGGGPAYLFESKDMPELADSWLYGIITAEVGIQFIEEKNYDLRVGYMIEHISSPFPHGDDPGQRDPGWNAGGISAQFTLNF